MSTYLPRPTILALLASLFALTTPSYAETTEIDLPGDSAYPESISAGSDGTLCVGNPSVGGVWRIDPKSSAVERWIKPGAFGTRSLLGVLVDAKANRLFVCSNDFSSSGIPGPSSVAGSFVKGFDLATGEGKVSAALPGKAAICNDMAVGPDGSLFITNSLEPQILRLKLGSSVPQGAPGLDGIAFGADGNLYVNTFAPGGFFRVEVTDGKPGALTNSSRRAN